VKILKTKTPTPSLRMESIGTPAIRMATPQEIRIVIITSSGTDPDFLWKVIIYIMYYSI
jgi:hypothetical protein